LSTQALRVLELARRLRTSNDPGALIFPGFTRYGHLSENAILALLARAGFYGRQTGHGFRASFSTWANETHAADPDVIEACLAHKPAGVRHDYNHATYLAQRRQGAAGVGRSACEKMGDETAMKPDWRKPGDYPPRRSLQRWAWEFLRRNPAFNAELAAATREQEAMKLPSPDWPLVTGGASAGAVEQIPRLRRLAKVGGERTGVPPWP
jgi:hypothetical protein